MVLFFLVSVWVMVRFSLVLFVLCECEVFSCMNGLNMVFSLFLVRFGLLLWMWIIMLCLVCFIFIFVDCLYIIVLFIRLENNWCMVSGCSIIIVLLVWLKCMLVLVLVVFFMMFFSSEFSIRVVCCLVFLVLWVSFRFLWISVCIVFRLLIRCLCSVLLVMFFSCSCSWVIGVCRLWVIVVSICVCLFRCCCRCCCMVLKVLVVCLIFNGLVMGIGVFCRLLFSVVVVVVRCCSGVLVMCVMM